jgi:multicomponent Na+:H+ antiporter subunit E
MKTIVKYSYQVLNLIILFFYFCFKIVQSGWIVGWLVLKGYRGDNGGMVEYAVQSTNPWHIILLFNLMSMTPGSLSIDLSEDHRTISVHLLNFADRDSFLKTSNKIERMLIRTFNAQVNININPTTEETV